MSDFKTLLDKIDMYEDTLRAFIETNQGQPVAENPVFIKVIERELDLYMRAGLVYDCMVNCGNMNKQAVNCDQSLQFTYSVTPTLVTIYAVCQHKADLAEFILRHGEQLHRFEEVLNAY